MEGEWLENIKRRIANHVVEGIAAFQKVLDLASCKTAIDNIASANPITSRRPGRRNAPKSAARVVNRPFEFFDGKQALAAPLRFNIMLMLFALPNV